MAKRSVQSISISNNRLKVALAASVSVVALMLSQPAEARRQLIPERPSVEVNLEVLRYLNSGGMPPVHSTISKAPPAINTMPFRQAVTPTAPLMAAPAPSRLAAPAVRPQPPVTRAARPVLPPPPPPTGSFARSKPHVWGDGAPQSAPAVQPKPITPKTQARPAPVMNMAKPAPSKEPVPVTLAPTPTPLTKATPASVAATPKAPLVIEEPPQPAVVEPAPLATAKKPLPKPDLSDVTFDDFPTLEPLPDMPPATQMAEKAPAPAPSVTKQVEKPAAQPRPVAATAPKMPIQKTAPKAAPLNDLPIALPEPTPLPIPDVPKARVAAKTATPKTPEPANVALPNIPDMPPAPMDMANATPPKMPNAPTSVVPSLSKGLDDFMVKDDAMTAPKPAADDLPNLDAITGSAEPFAPVDDVSQGLPSLEALTGEPDMPPLPPMDNAAIVPEMEPLPELEALPPLDMKAPEPIDMPKAAPRAEQEIAALPPAIEAPAPISKPKATSGKALTINFAATETEVPDSELSKLSSFAKQLASSGQSVRIEAFAGGSPEQANVARRVSLSRALAIRAYLIDNGVPNLNINVQPLGNKVSGDPERADIIYQ